MKTSFLLTASALLFAGAVSAQVTPASEPIADEKETTITCELTQAPSLTEAPVLDSPKEAEATKGTYHYKLRLPKGYSTDAQKRWPCIFIMSPSGNAFRVDTTPLRYTMIRSRE